MALGTNPDFLTIQAFFAGSNSMVDYVRGGLYVPNIAANAAISTTAAGLALTQFSGADKASVVITLNAHTVSDDGAANGGQGKSRITAGADGVLRWSTQWMGVGSYAGEWATNLDAGANYEAMATTTAGTAGQQSTGTVGTWVNLGADVYWQKGRLLSGSDSWTFTLAIRKVGTTVTLDSASMVLWASGGGAGGDPCVVMGSWVDPNTRVEEVRTGYVAATFRPEEGFQPHAVESVLPARQVPCVKVTTVRGAVLRCSAITPFNLKSAQYDRQDGHWKRAEDMEGELVIVLRDKELCWEEVLEVEDIGLQWVVPLSFGGRSFPAGDDWRARIYSHNMAKMPQ